MGDRPQILLPGGRVTESGIYLPAAFAPPPEAVDVPSELRPPERFVVVGSQPSFIDQVWAFATEEELGLRQTSREEIVGALAEIPFWPAMRRIAAYQRDLWPVRTDPEGQKQLLHRWFGTDSQFVEAATAFVSAGPQRVLFSERQLFALQKLVILHGKESSVNSELSDVEYLGLMICLAAIPGSILGVGEEEIAAMAVGDGPDDERWLKWFFGHGGLIGRGSTKHELHCKRSGGTPAARVTDFEELVAQAIRSVPWQKPGPAVWSELRYRLEHRNATRIISGDRGVIEATLDGWIADPPLVDWLLWVVQPGLSVAQLDGSAPVTALLNIAYSWASTQNVTFSVVCSD